MSLGVAAVQFQSALYRPDENRARTLDLIDQAAAAGAKLVILPELSISGYGIDRDGLEACAEPVDGPTLQAWQAAAARLGIHIAGGFCERADGRLYNAAMLVGPDGLVGHYRKLHLFDREKHVFTPGDLGLPVADLPFGKVGICVCYDLRFVEVVRALALKGASIIAVPTAWVGGFDADPFDAMGYIGQARGAILQANLSQVFICCASQPGRRDDVRFLGSSLIVDPWGTVLAGPLDPDREGIALAAIDPSAAKAAQVRSELVRPREDRRTDVYAITVDGTAW
ncbi:nitrilase-related carbon-nitrogen hydrolase [Methylobrevis pamukkalensis]|uniref:(R)-stereoselective amidase n=1 Tax=Methylobrevis pamukkalensis TaxID=1439726 RepID=A0A1E3H948_9HYPH|nr:nitrilase-related carbon-nitrogen hydrolase [Methylobrevis pamukkalensis]ODN72316.1 (R)-stereoselective amidase [Methylobrevis pamukkalensis]